jgi:hypothetical protein
MKAPIVIDSVSENWRVFNKRKAPIPSAPAIIPVVYHVDVQAYYDALTDKPSTDRMNQLDVYVKGLDDAGIWDVTGWILQLANDSSEAGLKNIKFPSKNASLINSEAWDSGGVTGDGVSSYVSLIEAPGDGGVYSLNSAGIYCYCNSQTGSTGITYHHGVSQGRAFLAPRTSGSETYEINDATNSDVFMASNGSRVGGRGIYRRGASEKVGYFGTTQVSNLTTASTSIATNAASIHRFNTFRGTDRIATYWLGGALDDTQAKAMHTLTADYLSYFGVS